MAIQRPEKFKQTIKKNLEILLGLVATSSWT